MIAIAEASAFVAAAALATGLADLVLLFVLTVYSVCTGNEQQLMTYVSLLMTALMGTCIAYDAYGQVTVSGEKGSRTIDTDTVKKGAENRKTYYHVTTREGASQIIKEQKLYGKEFREVYAWSKQPTLEQAQNSGARSVETVVSFETHSNVFQRDMTVSKELQDIACVSTRPSPISINNPKEVGFK